jgi:hypothetical protein
MKKKDESLSISMIGLAKMMRWVMSGITTMTISLLSDGSEPDLSNISIDDITAYTYIHDYYGL